MIEKIQEKKNLIKNYTLVFAVISFTVFGYILIKKGSLLTPWDGVNYLLPLSAYIKRVYDSILHSFSFTWYDFSLGFGNNILETLIWSGITDPFNFLLLLGEKENVIEISTVITILKLYVSGLACIICFSKGCKNDKWILVCSLQYIFSGYLYQALVNPSFTSTLITFPIIISGIGVVIDEKRYSKRLVFAIAYQSICGIYFLYINLIWGGIFALIMLIEHKKNFADKVKVLFKGIICVLLGMGISLFSIIPQISGFFKSARTHGISLQINGIFGATTDYLGKLFTPYTIERSWLGIGLSVLMIVPLVKALLTKKIKLSYKVITILSIMCVFSVFCGKIVNASEFPRNERWLYIPVFFICYLVSNLEFEELFIYTKLEAVISLVIFAVGLFYLIYIARIYVLICYVLLFLLCCIIKKNREKKVIYLLLFSLLIYNLFSYNLLSYGHFLPRKNWERAVSNNSINECYTPVDEDNVSRVDLFNIDCSMENAGAYYNSFETSQYLSCANGYLYSFYSKYGLIGVAGDGLHFQGLDGRIILENIFATKYYSTYVDDVPKISTNMNYQWFTVYENAVRKDLFDKLSYIQRYDLLTKAGVVEENSYDISFADDEIIEKNNYEICNFSLMPSNFSNDYISVNENEQLSILIKGEISDEYEYYVSVDKLYRTGSLYGYIEFDEKRIELYNEKDLFVRVYPDERGIINITTSDSVYMNGLNVYRYHIKSGENELINTNVATGVMVSNSSIEGDVCGKNKLVCVPIFYDENFVVTINDVEVLPIVVNNGFIGVVTTEEKNHISISYRYADKITLYVLLSGLFLLILIILIKTEKKKDKDVLVGIEKD